MRVYDLTALRRATLLLSALVALIATGVAVPANASEHNLADRTIRLGSTYTITGHTASLQGNAPRADGPVVLTGRWSGERWRVLVRTTTHGDGSYRLSVRPGRRGRLELRLATPDHRVGNVVLTVT